MNARDTVDERVTIFSQEFQNGFHAMDDTEVSMLASMLADYKKQILKEEKDELDQKK